MGDGRGGGETGRERGKLAVARLCACVCGGACVRMSGRKGGGGI